MNTPGSNWTLRIEPLQVGFMPLQNTPGSSLCPVRMKQNHVCLEARKQALTRHRICRRLDLARLRFQNDEKEMSGISTPVCLWYFITHYSGITYKSHTFSFRCFCCQIWKPSGNISAPVNAGWLGCRCSKRDGIQWSLCSHRSPPLGSQLTRGHGKRGAKT